MRFARFASFGLVFLLGSAAAAQTFQGLDFSPKKKSKPTTVTVTLGTDVKGARLFIDGKPVGELPREEPQPVTAGKHTVRVERLGYKPWEQKITFARGPNEVTVVLEPEGGIFAIGANEVGAVCSIDGGAEEPLPLTTVLAPGKHQLRISKAGFAPATVEVEAEAGIERTINAELHAVVADRPGKGSLEPPERDADLDAERGGAITQVAKDTGEPLYTKWYLWAGVAAAVVAGVTVAVVATNRPPAPVEPTTVCHGPCDVTIGSPTGVLPLRR